VPLALLACSGLPALRARPQCPRLLASKVPAASASAHSLWTQTFGRGRCCSSTGAGASRARQLRLRTWFNFGIAASLLMGFYSCVLLITEITVLLGRLGLVRVQVRNYSS
jgi:hypothetical protein